MHYADFDADLQSTQINSIMLQKPDIIAAVPTEDEKNCELFKKVGKKTKLVFMSHIPNGISSSEISGSGFSFFILPDLIRLCFSAWIWR